MYTCFWSCHVTSVKNLHCAQLLEHVQCRKRVARCYMHLALLPWFAVLRLLCSFRAAVASPAQDASAVLVLQLLQICFAVSASMLQLHWCCSELLSANQHGARENLSWEILLSVRRLTACAWRRRRSFSERYKKRTCLNVFSFSFFVFPFAIVTCCIG